MAGENKGLGMTVETEVAQDSTYENEGGQATIRRPADSNTVDVDLGKIGQELEEKEGDAQRAEGEGNEEAAVEDEAAIVGELGEWNPNDAETLAKYDTFYQTKDGALNQKVIGTEFWANFAKAKEAGGDEVKATGHLNPATYAYLKDTYKVDDAFIEEFELGQVALAKEKATGANAGVFAKVEGGEPAYRAATTWAKTGYTKEQQTRFNKLVEGGDAEARDEAIELLMTRYYAKNPDARQRQAGPRVRNGRGRASSPNRNAEGGTAPRRQAQAEADVFATQADYQTAWRTIVREGNEAERTGNRPAMRDAANKRDAARAKAKRSPWFAQSTGRK